MPRWNSRHVLGREQIFRQWQRVTTWLWNERGSASLEFLGVGVLLLVPIAYGILTLVQLEQAMLATELAARNAARTLVAEGSPASGQPLAAEHIAWAMLDQGLDPNAAQVITSCSPNPDCEVLGDVLTVTVRVEMPLPLLPGGDGGLAIPVESSATFPRERFESAP